MHLGRHGGTVQLTQHQPGFTMTKTPNTSTRFFTAAGDVLRDLLMELKSRSPALHALFSASMDAGAYLSLRVGVTKAGALGLELWLVPADGEPMLIGQEDA